MEESTIVSDVILRWRKRLLSEPRYRDWQIPAWELAILIDCADENVEMPTQLFSELTAYIKSKGE